MNRPAARHEEREGKKLNAKARRRKNTAQCDG
jgi:hypothetical protein